VCASAVDSVEPGFFHHASFEVDLQPTALRPMQAARPAASADCFMASMPYIGAAAKSFGDVGDKRAKGRATQLTTTSTAAPRALYGLFGQ
jgi:hypothetical protein